MLIQFGFGQIYAGKPASPAQHYDTSIELCLGRRDDVPEKELPWRIIMSLSWDWLPVRKYKSLCPTILVPPTDRERLRSVLLGRPAPWHEVADHRGLNSSKWTGRERKFVGIGQWHWRWFFYRATRRSLMHVYLTGAKERSQPLFMFSVCPGHSGLMKPEEVPSDWKTADGKDFRTFYIEFKHGRAEVEQQLGEWLLKHKMVQRTNLVRPTGNTMIGSLAATIRGQR